MKIEDMDHMELVEMTLRWNIEYEQSYLDSLRNGEIAFTKCTTELEMLHEHELAQQQLDRATKTYYTFLSENPEWFI